MGVQDVRIADLSHRFRSQKHIGAFGDNRGTSIARCLRVLAVHFVLCRTRQADIGLYAPWFLAITASLKLVSIECPAKLVGFHRAALTHRLGFTNGRIDARLRFHFAIEASA